VTGKVGATGRFAASSGRVGKAYKVLIVDEAGLVRHFMSRTLSAC
jgi:hypothetical protein